MDAGKSIGSLQTWEPPDKSFSKHLLKAGSGDTLPNEGSVCVVQISLIDKHEIDEEDLDNYKLGEEVELTVGEGDSNLARLFDRVLMSMKEGERAYIKSKVNAKGEKVSEFDVAGKSALKFNIMLKSLSRAADPGELEPDERLERAQHFKDKGTELYQQAKYEFAIKRFQSAAQYLQDMEPLKDVPTDLRQQHGRLTMLCYLNLGACYLKTEQYAEVEENCTKALSIEADNVKGLFRRGQAYRKLSKYPEAMKDLNAARKKEPGNKAVLTEIRSMEDLVKKEKQMYQKMFSNSNPL